VLSLVVVALSVTTAPAGADLLVLDLKPISVDAAEARIVDGLIAEAIGDVVASWPTDARPKVATGDDIRTLATIEAERAATGCDDASCLAEIAGALGARYVVSGTLGKLGDDRVLQLSLFDVKASQTLERGNATAATPKALAPQIKDLVARVMKPIAPTTSPAPAVKNTTSMSPLFLGGAITAGVAGAVAIGSGAYAAILDARLAADSSATSIEKREALDTGPAVVGVAAVSAVVTIVAIGVSGAGLAMGGDS
jgi:hypothetical protein